VNLPAESACFRALHPHHEHTHDLELLRSVEHSLRWLVWSKTKSAPKGVDVPEYYRFPWESEPDDGAFKGDPMTTDEADDWLGWADLKTN